MKPSTELVFGLAVLVLASVFVACGDDDEEEADTGNGTTRSYDIALGNNYPPYDVSALNGLNFDVLTAVCAANANMECNIVDAPYTDCFDNDADGNPMVGAKLADGTFDGCMGWFITQTRIDLGIVFSDDYTAGLPVSLIQASGGAALSGTDLGGATVGFFSGFFNDDGCLGDYYSNFETQFYGGDTFRQDALADLADGTIDYLFWDAAPPLDPPTDAEYVGDPIGDCPDQGLAMAGYGDTAADLASDFNAGLSAIRADGTFEQICTDAETEYGMGDPNCLDE
jgi:ABC-type amino acid transport substrate-binding protein